MQAATEKFMATVADRVFNFSAGPAVLPLPVAMVVTCLVLVALS